MSFPHPSLGGVGLEPQLRHLELPTNYPFMLVMMVLTQTMIALEGWIPWAINLVLKDSGMIETLAQSKLAVDGDSNVVIALADEIESSLNPEDVNSPYAFAHTAFIKIRDSIVYSQGLFQHVVDLPAL